MVIKENETFFKQWFYRSLEDNKYSWIFILWNFERNIPQVWFFYLNSWLNLKPSYFFNQEEFWKLYNAIFKSEDFENEVISFSFKDWDLNIMLKHNNKEFSLTINSLEILLFKNYLIYISNYLNNFQKVKSITIINNYLDEKINQISEKISFSDYNNTIYRWNKIIDTLWEVKDIYIPLVEESFHVFKDNNKSSYYFKFFPEYLSSIRNEDKEQELINVSWIDYPFQIIVQQDNVKGSKIITLNEIDFLLLFNFIKNPSYFLEENGITKKLKEDWIIHIQNNFSITLTNHNKWKVYVNKDSLREDVYLKLKKLYDLWDFNNLFKQINWLRQTWKLINNKFVAFDMMKDIKFSEEKFINLKFARSELWKINENSSILQIWKIVWSEDFTINFISWDLEKWWVKFLTAPISQEKLFSFIYKLNTIHKFITNPINYTKALLYNNLETIRFLDLDKKDILNGLNDEFVKILNYKKIPFFQKFSFNYESWVWEFNVFFPNIIKKFNTSLFAIKEGIKDLSKDRYPISLFLKDSEWNKICNFTMEIWDLYLIKNNLEKQLACEFIGKTWNNEFQKIKFVFLQNRLYCVYWKSFSINNFSKNSIKFQTEINSNEILDITSKIIDSIENVWDLLLKWIFYSKNNII